LFENRVDYLDDGQARLDENQHLLVQEKQVALLDSPAHSFTEKHPQWPFSDFEDEIPLLFKVFSQNGRFRGIELPGENLPVGCAQFTDKCWHRRLLGTRKNPELIRILRER